MNREPLDPTCKKLRPLAEYTERLPSRCRGKKLNRATLWRWVLRGSRGGGILRTVALGAGRFTCDAWVCEFLAPGGLRGGPVRPPAQLGEAERRRIARDLGADPDRRSA